MGEDNFPLIVQGLRKESSSVVSLELSRPEGGKLPEWEPGAHLDIILPSGIARQYSLCSDPADLEFYRVAVLREPNGRGGSEELHTNVAAGSTLMARGPRNHFTLEDGASHYLLVAGGIGITPILSMARHLTSEGKSAKLIYCGSSRQRMAFIDELEESIGDALALYPRDEKGRADLLTEVANAPAGTVVYACGPEPLLSDLETTTKTLLGEDAFRAEKFTATKSPILTDEMEDSSEETEFEVELTQSECTLTVPKDKTILDVVSEVNDSIMSSCEEGFCGTCETRVRAGDVDHRDTILSDREKAANKTMFICVSRSKGPKLVIDA